MDILIIGNGFDIENGLPTKYTDFLEVIRNPQSFTSAIYKMKSNQYDKKLEKYYHPDLSKVNFDNLNKMASILSDNSWAEYFSRCGADIQGWIDFEREIIPVIEMFRETFKLAPYADVRVRDDAPLMILDLERNDLARKTGLFPKYFSKTRGNRIFTSNGYVHGNYGLMKEKMLEDLKNELDQFIEAYRIYLMEIVDTKSIDEKMHKSIAEINADAILSFNYTNTELKYTNLKGADRYHIHGDISSDNSLVLGVNQVDGDEANEYIYFVKYFQRIRRRINQKYKELLDAPYGFNLTLFGHSLDITDEDIIKPFIRSAEKVRIYYYDQRDYESKIINLINLFDREWVELKMYNNEICFKMIERKMI